jgi:hypothetical protein
LHCRDRNLLGRQLLARLDGRFPWRPVALAAGSLSLVGAGLALGFVGSASGAATAVPTAVPTTAPASTTTSTPLPTTTAPPPDPAPVVQTPKREPRQAHTRPAVPAQTSSPSGSTHTSYNPQPTPAQPPPASGSVSPPRTVSPTHVSKPRPRPIHRPRTRSAPKAPIRVTAADRVVSTPTTHDFSRALVIVTLGLAILLLGVAVTPPRVVPSTALAWMLSSQVVNISFAGLVLLFLAAIEYVFMRVAL